MNLSHAAFQIIEKLDTVTCDDEKKSVWSIIIEQIKKLDSFNGKYIDWIEKEIRSFIKTLADQEKIKLYNETEAAMTNPAENNSTVISSIVMDLEMELLGTITDEAWEYADCKQKGI